MFGSWATDGDADEPLGPTEEVDTIEDHVHPAVGDAVSVGVRAVMQVVRLGRQDDATPLEPPDARWDAPGVCPLVEDVRAQRADGEGEQEAVGEHRPCARYVRAASPQGEKQWGDDDDVVGAVLLEEPVPCDRVGVVVVIAERVYDGPADQRSIRCEKGVTKPVDGPREDVGQEIPDQEPDGQPLPSRRCQLRTDHPYTEQHEYADRNHERPALHHRKGRMLLAR